MLRQPACRDPEVAHPLVELVSVPREPKPEPPAVVPALLSNGGWIEQCIIEYQDHRLALRSEPPEAVKPAARQTANHHQGAQLFKPLVIRSIGPMEFDPLLRLEGFQGRLEPIGLRGGSTLHEQTHGLRQAVQGMAQHG